MVATTQNRNTPSVAGHRRGHPVAAGEICRAGTIAVVEAGTGFVKEGTTALDLIAVGIFEHLVDNRVGNDGEQTVQVLRGFARLENSVDADEITAADAFKRCYIVDNQTVAKTDGGGTRSVAGIVDAVDDAGVWVLIDPTSGAALDAPAAE
ncbi:hypothetical protein [Stutzerimonas nitrititolerans]|uniref:hypothetical protein n=1 Tax=Stutzerimonas nitrititolerans TaxID=2482751 RepID=UPI0028A58784|nr:hypothetical protein [Stutzerimonas nitrititolerans]